MYKVGLLALLFSVFFLPCPFSFFLFFLAYSCPPSSLKKKEGSLRREKFTFSAFFFSTFIGIIAFITAVFFITGMAFMGAFVCITFIAFMAWLPSSSPPSSPCNDHLPPDHTMHDDTIGAFFQGGVPVGVKAHCSMGRHTHTDQANEPSHRYFCASPS